MSFSLEHFSADGKHIKLCASGDIELYGTEITLESKSALGIEVTKKALVTISYAQANMLKEMILAESKLKQAETK